MQYTLCLWTEQTVEIKVSEDNNNVHVHAQTSYCWVLSIIHTHTQSNSKKRGTWMWKWWWFNLMLSPSLQQLIVICNIHNFVIAFLFFMETTIERDSIWWNSKNQFFHWLLLRETHSNFFKKHEKNCRENEWEIWHLNTHSNALCCWWW